MANAAGFMLFINTAMRTGFILKSVTSTKSQLVSYETVGYKGFYPLYKISAETVDARYVSVTVEKYNSRTGLYDISSGCIRWNCIQDFLEDL